MKRSFGKKSTTEAHFWERIPPEVDCNGACLPKTLLQSTSEIDSLFKAKIKLIGLEPRLCSPSVTAEKKRAQVRLCQKTSAFATTHPLNNDQLAIEIGIHISVENTNY
jgi:hypothetical protein